MARQKILSDETVLDEARRLFVQGGAKALSFGTLAQATGLAPATLAQRFGTIAGLHQATYMAAWQALIAKADALCIANPSKGPQGWLRLLDPLAVEALKLIAADARSAATRDQAALWRSRIEGGLALRLGQGEKSRMAAQSLFLAWQGQVLWQHISSGAGELKLKELAKKLS